MNRWGLVMLLALAVPSWAADDVDTKLFEVQRQMAEKGDASAMYYLGEMYEQGLGTRTNVDEAFKWYKDAADKGDRLAQHKMAKRHQIMEQHRREQAEAEAARLAERNAARQAAEDAARRAREQSKSTADQDKAAREAEAAEQARQEAGAAKKRAALEEEKKRKRAEIRKYIESRMKDPHKEPFE